MNIQNRIINLHSSAAKRAKQALSNSIGSREQHTVKNSQSGIKNLNAIATSQAKRISKTEK
ncbi:hypothetical protein Osc7112_6882 (plasmid) [Oscillatoria nigro-viridis PCC 7112]|uniref:Uncharacterized protein n=1 Tax=Phormidium nigroviride PCC 7112 TaxID=179408 RepID=K9VU09_9CYAN|nr:hypothetical protein [Oscillatoria nigro-viridis]AFZ10962.1 hypothetical protein Osc7112_6882 [Oscillatoria nigro-viridis PCC 7112]